MYSRAKVAVIGSGFSGTLTAIRMLQFSEVPMDIYLFERDDGFRYGGLAYGAVPTTWDHMLNIQAGRITLFREYPADFLEWINNRADRCERPAKWKYHKFGLSCVVPRRIYAQYLKESLITAVAAAHQEVTLHELTGEVVDLAQSGQGCEITYIASDQGKAEIQTLYADYTVLATGHLETTSKPFYDAIRHTDRFVQDPYSRAGTEILGEIRPDENVLIVGSALSAFDAIISLLNHKHEGLVTICSRHAYMHKTYPTDHQHDILEVRRPPFLDQEQLTPEVVVEGIKAEFAALKRMFMEEHAIPESVVPERVMKAWEPYVIELVQRMDAKDLQMLFDQYKSMIVTSRTSTVHEIGEVVRNRMSNFAGAPKRLAIVSEHIKDMRLIEGDRKVCVTFAKSLDPMVVDRVINCLGNTTDFSTTKLPLWRALVNERKFAQVHKKTRRGVEVGQHGELIAADGKVSDRVFCVGPMRQGDETARRGRLGAFVFSIGTLRNQCFDTATEVLRRIGHDAKSMLMMVPEHIHHCLGKSTEWLSSYVVGKHPDCKEDGLREYLMKHAQELYPLYRDILMSQRHKDRMVLKQRVAKDAQGVRLRLASDFGLKYEDAREVEALLTALTEKNAVHNLCDIKHLAKWQPSEYSAEVKAVVPPTPVRVNAA